MNFHLAARLSLPLSAVILLLVAAVTAVRTNAQDEGPTDAGPGVPEFIQPSAEQIEAFRGATLSQQEEVLAATINCIRDRGFDAFEQPGTGLRRGNLSAIVNDPDLTAFHAAVSECSYSNGLDAMELAVVADMLGAPPAARANALALYEACVASSEPSRDELQDKIN